MRTDTKEMLDEAEQLLCDLGKHVYDYDYDREVLWYINQAKEYIKLAKVER